MRKLAAIFLLAVLFYSPALLGQRDLSAKTWHFIDTSIANKRNLSDVLELVRQLRQQATKANNYYQVSRTYEYELMISDQRSEDSLYFKNSAFIDTLERQATMPDALHLWLELAKARRLKNFTSGYRRFQRKQYERQDIIINYAAYSNAQLDSIAARHFVAAKRIAEALKNDPVDEGLWLSSDPLQFLFKPSLYDIVIAEQIKLTLAKYHHTADREGVYRWLALSASAFVSQIDSFSRSDDSFFSDFYLYKEWLSAHKDIPANWFFIESVAREYLYSIAKDDDPVIEEIYVRYLQGQVQSPYSIVKAYGVYQLCLLWNSQAARYMPSPENYSIYRYKKNIDDYDEKYRYHPLKALQLFDKNKELLDSFYYLKTILVAMEARIKQPLIDVSMERHNLPGEPMLAEVKFKNVDSIYYRIIPIADADNVTVSYTRYGEFLNKMIKRPHLFEKAVDLPPMDDYNKHASHLKLDALPAGQYVALVSSKPIRDTLGPVAHVKFDVTDISVLNNDTRIYVLHRKTGMPLTGAEVVVNKPGVQDTDKKSAVLKFIANKEGYILLPDRYKHTNIGLNIRWQGDSSYENVMNHARSRWNDESDIYEKDVYDDLLEFYEDNATAYIFTDRSIYRPGQLVHYKALFVTKDKNTGEAMVMSKKNLKGGLFGNLYKKWLKESEPWLFITDPFSREMDSLKIVPNEYGAVSGVFRIPKTAATGEWQIEPDVVGVDYNSGSFRVEEYKRPSYEITVENPKKELQPGDPFTVKVKLRSFAGATLNNVRVNYSVIRRGDKVGPYDGQRMAEKDFVGELLDTSGYTDANGVLEILLDDTAISKYKGINDQWNFDYRTLVEAVEATGESYGSSLVLHISNRPVLIRMNLAKQYERSFIRPVLITTEDRNAGAVSKPVVVSIYRTEKKQKVYNRRKLFKSDVWLYDKDELQQAFPFLPILEGEIQETRSLVFRDTIHTGTGEKLVLDPSLLVAGNYAAEAQYLENGVVLGEAKTDFRVFDKAQHQLPVSALPFNHLHYASSMPGDTLRYFYSHEGKATWSIFNVSYYKAGKKMLVSDYTLQHQGEGIDSFLFRIPKGVIGEIKLSHIYVLNNEVFKNEETIAIAEAGSFQPEITIEKYRKTLVPGSKETFTVSIKTKNENIAAELLTTMYDASLDKLNEHEWRTPDSYGDYRSIYTHWQNEINSTRNTNYVSDQIGEMFVNGVLQERARKNGLWWLNPLGHAYDEDLSDGPAYSFVSTYRSRFQHDMNPDARWLMGKIPGLQLSDADGLSEVIVVGYSTVRAKAITGSSVVVRGAAGIKGFLQPMIVIDGEIYQGNPNDIDLNTITAGLILKGADAEAIYGARAAQGVLVLSTKGPVVLPGEPEPVITPRKNFEETAFFFPEVHADKDGLYSFSFTMPETLTEWNWMMLAHTRDARFVYKELTLNSRLPLMVQPNMPRLLYQGDRIVLQSRITNLDSLVANGKIVCRIEDEVTGEDITSKLMRTSEQSFNVSVRSNTNAGFEINIPSAQVNPLKIVISARSGSFTDAEEHVIPVLSPKVFIRESRPFSLVNHMDTVMQPPVLAGAEPYGVGLYIQPKPQAALIQSLPYLANYPYGCAEQTFNRLLAHIVALKIMRTDSIARHSFNEAKGFVEKQKSSDEKLPDQLAEETMPWMNIFNQTANQHKQLFDLLDTSKSKPAITELGEKIFKMQQADGGIAWFNGGGSNFYISCYLLRGFGKLEKENPSLMQASTEYNAFIGKLVKYCDNAVESATINDRYLLVYYMYARSHWLSKYLLPASLGITVRSKLADWWRITDGNTSLQEQALAVLASFAYGLPGTELLTNGKARLRSLQQLAINDERNGMRWKDLSDATDLSSSSEETIVLLAEAFAAGGSNINADIIKWLLTARSEHHWASTKATAAAIDLLSKEDKNITDASQTLVLNACDSTLIASNDMLKGNAFDFTGLSAWPSAVQLNKQVDIPASGNLVWYYFTGGKELSKLNKEIELDRKFYKWNSVTNTWEPLSENATLKIADKVKVVISIQTSRRLSYVYIDDKRAAGFEPVENNSGYKWKSGMSYYQSVRDAGSQFFTETVPAGRHEISYELKVAHEGQFAAGPAVLQCMYKPEISAYSDSKVVTTTK
jgi:alpha-2-macroglobulin